MDAEAVVLRAIGYAARVVAVPDARYRAALDALVPRPAAVAAGDPHAPSDGHLLFARRSLKSAAAPVAADAVVEGRVGSAVHVSEAGTVPVMVGPDVLLRDARAAAHRVTFAEQAIPELTSWRMDEPAAVIDPVEGLDFTSLRLR